MATNADASITYYLRTSGTWATSDRFYFETSPNGTTWATVVRVHRLPRRRRSRSSTSGRQGTV